jgi:hypothetical protein
MDVTQLLVCFHIISVYELYDAHIAIWLKQHDVWHAELTEIGIFKIYGCFIALFM